MEVLRGARRLANLNVVEGGKLEEPLNARAGMLGALAFEAVRQEEHDAAEAAPLGFSAGDELVDDNLGGVGEVAELGLPHYEAFRAVEAVAVVEAEDARF